MNELDRFEREIAALRPREVTPELERRISARLAERAEPATTGGRRAVRIRWSIAGGLLAASFAAIALWFAGNESRDRQTGAGATQVPSTIAFDESLPSVWSYRLASRRSSDSLETLLDRHGDKRRTPRSTDDRIVAFSPFGRSTGFLDIEL